MYADQFYEFQFGYSIRILMILQTSGPFHKNSVLQNIYIHHHKK